MVKPVLYCLLFTLAMMGTGCTGNDQSGEQMVDLEEVTDDQEGQLNALNAAIRSSRKDASLYARRAVLYLQQQEPEKALTDANEAVRLSGNEPVNLFVKAQALRALNREGEALSFALQAERNGYQNVPLYVLLSDLYLRLQQFDKAREYNNLAYKLSPSDEYVLYYRGRIAAAAGDTTAAERNYKLAAEQVPDFFEPKRELAGIYIAGKDFNNAQKYIAPAQKQNNTDGLLWFYKGRLYQATEKPDSAIWSYSKAVELADTLIEAHSRLGYLHYARGHYDKAIAHLEKAAGEQSNAVRFYTTLASSYERTGQYRQALVQYEKLVSLEPAYSYAHKSIARLRKMIATIVIDSTAVQENIEE